ncbi:MAG: FAD-binding oxidoreductase [Actinomycetota bacterium]|nr:FAD-binding oxidoreductase [Actinomycetota bacterium]
MQTAPTVKATRTPAELADADARALARELAATIRGEVRFSPGSRALYATDLSAYRQVPIGVVIPRDVDDVVATVAACRHYGAPVLARGGGTSLGGQTCNVAVVLDFSKYMNRILELDPARKLARVEPGVICNQLRIAAQEHGLIWAPDPATYEFCTLGGMIANNSCGVHSVMAGRSSDNVEELEILTYDGVRLRLGATSDEELERITADNGRRGAIYRQLRELRDRCADLVRERYPDIPRRVSGYNLDDLLPEKGFHVARALAGTEGTCALTLAATVRLVPWPAARTLVVLGYPDQYGAADQLMDILAHGPIGLEAVDGTVIENMRRLRFNLREVDLYPEGGAWLLAEFGGDTRADAVDRARALMAELKRRSNGGAPSMKLFDDYAEQKRVWLVREGAIGVSRVPGELETWSCWEDAAVAPERLGDYLRDFKRLLDRHGYYCVFFGHYGQGCVHSRITFDLKSAEGVRRFRAFMEEASDLVLAYGGSLSGEHGDGQSHAELLPKMFGKELVEGFREFKAIWDPESKMNPGKVVDPYPLDSNLRLGAEYRPRPVKTHFRFPADHGSFAEATERCFGAGKCRRTEGGTMCPSFMVTREEMHTTRGRAHLLFEMLRGEAIVRGWRDEHVKESLDLCLACKGCKGDCPVSVDIATYKAEFLSHYYAGRLRPRSAYALGLVHWWARLAARAPALANLVTQQPLLARAAKAAAGLAPERALPHFASKTFTTWFRERGSRNRGGRRVVLWPDTFTNHLHPEIPRAAVEVLEAAGYEVELPRRSLCCGRPLYDYGMLALAKRQLRQILDALSAEIAGGVPVVGLEPSCIAVFRDELVNLFPEDERATRLARQSFLLGEFLATEPEYEPPRLERKAVVHGHCHQKAIMKLHADEALLRRVGLDFEILDSGCCGLAGSFGYEKGDHYDVSIKAGERALFPAVRDAAEEVLVVADGFSCREQIAHATDRRAVHLAEVLQMALHEEASAR